MQLELSKEIEKKHLKYFQEKVLTNFDIKPKFLNITNENIHIQFMNYCKTKFRVLAIGKPEDLRKFRSELPEEILSLIDENPMCSYRGKKLKYNKLLLNIFGYEKFCNLNQYVSKELLTQENYKQINSELKHYWTPYNFVTMSNVRACPYCNRQYITPIYIHSNEKNDKHKLRADLDHFYPKSKYPYFSMSIYNLVPCCKFCNSSLKHVKEFDITDVNPYEENFDDYFKFRTDILNDGDVYIEKTHLDHRIDRYLDYFQIESLYSYHKNQAEEMIQKRIIYPESYIDELYKNNELYFASKEEIKQLVIGYISDRGCLNDEAFLKFRRDIAEQLHFIDCITDDEQLEKLKELIGK